MRAEKGVDTDSERECVCVCALGYVGPPPLFCVCGCWRRRRRICASCAYAYTMRAMNIVACGTAGTNGEYGPIDVRTNVRPGAFREELT